MSKSRKSITALNDHKEILAAIKEGNLRKLQYYLLSTEYLDCIDHRGKSLLAIIQESSIDVNKTIPIEYANKLVIRLTPLHHLLMNNPGFSLGQLKLLLALGAHPNQIIDKNGNSVLHRYLKKGNDSIQTPVLQVLLAAKSDFFMKNKKNQTPLDLASTEMSIYIKRMLVTQPNNHRSAITLQRKWRLRSAKTELQDEKSKGSVTLNHPLLLRTAEKPVENPPDEKKMQQWVNAHDDIHKELAKKVVASVQYISHRHFIFGLKMATKKFNQFLLSLPKANRNYVLAVDSRDDKSGWWVTKLAEQYLIFPPKKIITTTEILDIKSSADLCNLVIFDDLSYSGNFYTNFLKTWEKALKSYESLLNIQLHLVIPFVSAAALTRLKEFNILLHYQEKIPNFNLPGTLFTAKTATYPAHKNPETNCSTIPAIERGISVNGKETGIAFAAKVMPPYKQKEEKLKNTDLPINIFFNRLA